MTGGTGREAATAVAVPPGASETLTGPGIVELLRDAAAAAPERVYCEWGDEEITFADLDERSDDVARGLAALGLRAGDVVCTMLKNHPDHVLVFFALLKLGVVWVPLNTHLRGASLTHIWTETRCSALVYDGECDAQIEPLFESHRPWVRVRRRSGGPPAVAARAFDDVVALGRKEPALAPVAESSDRTICISYTSGTTGRPKGVLLTDRMLRTCAVGVGVVTQPQPGDVFLVWEPLHHIGGSQMLLVPLLAPVRLVLVERFSASRFWPLARARGVTHVHYLGGILQILLKQP
ncbi:MAG TPA: AMP-binding protein, partial [Actinomycetota bacterium]|nr:AMP-binding protein [Actinomycetota bacterium]